MAEGDPQRELAMYRGLLEVSHLINAATNLESLMHSILEVAQRVLDAEAGGLFLTDPDRDELVLRVALAPSGISMPAGRIAVPRGHGIAGWVAKSGQAALVPDAYADPRFYRDADQQTGFRTRSIVCAPLLHDGREIGVLQMLNPRSKPTFDPLDLEALTAYAQLAATAYARLEILGERERQAVLRRELDLAADIQRNLLPHDLPTAPGAKLHACYLPARQVGGDFYTARLLETGVLWFAIGDVAGKGIPASLRMAQALGILDAILDADSSPSLVMGQWNRALCIQAGQVFVTATLGRWAGDGRLELAVAGHPDPWILPASGVPHPARLPGGPPLGILPEAIHPLSQLDTTPGDALLFYTDGLPESRSPEGAELGDTDLPGLFATLRGGSRPFLDALLEAEARHRSGQPARDDLSLLLLECTSFS